MGCSEESHPIALPQISSVSILNDYYTMAYPYTRQYRHNKPIIGGFVNDKSIDMLLDSGADATLMPKQTLLHLCETVHFQKMGHPMLMYPFHKSLEDKNVEEIPCITEFAMVNLRFFDFNFNFPVLVYNSPVFSRSIIIANDIINLLNMTSRQTLGMVTVHLNSDIIPRPTTEKRPPTMAEAMQYVKELCRMVEAEGKQLELRLTTVYAGTGEWGFEHPITGVANSQSPKFAKNTGTRIVKGLDVADNERFLFPIKAREVEAFKVTQLTCTLPRQSFEANHSYLIRVVSKPVFGNLSFKGEKCIVHHQLDCNSSTIKLPFTTTTWTRLSPKHPCATVVQLNYLQSQAFEGIPETTKEGDRYPACSTFTPVTYHEDVPLPFKKETLTTVRDYNKSEWKEVEDHIDQWISKEGNKVYMCPKENVKTANPDGRWRLQTTCDVGQAVIFVTYGNVVPGVSWETTWGTDGGFSPTSKIEDYSTSC